MKLLHTDTLQEAREKLDFHTQEFLEKIVPVKSQQALGRISACDVYSQENIPSFRRSTVDGYAIFAEDCYGAGESSPVFLEVADRIPIEKRADCVLIRGQAAQVQTGSMIPDGATAVVMVEYCDSYAADKIVVNRSVSVGENVTKIGEDIRQGECLIRRGQKITSREIGMLAALGIAEIQVLEPLYVTIISTGDELVEPVNSDGATGTEETVGAENLKNCAGQARSLSGSQIRDINSWSLAALAEEYGFIVRECIRTRDIEEDIYQAVLRGSEQSDIVVLTGGSSKGDKDYTEAVLHKITGNVFTHGISIKPGKPTILSYDRERQTIIAGLPGHPMAAWMMFKLMLCDWQERRFGIPKKHPVFAVMEENVSSNQGRETCLLVRLAEGEEEYGAYPVYSKSGSISSLSKADGYTLIPRNREGLKKGEKVKVELW